ncbi:MAG TPA: formyltransferase, partial [Candidatus Binatia bacterium]|nr:formyltransferase [Candidatus Binatia bacterium]
MRNVLLAYHDIGAVLLEELIASGDELALVITHDDRPGEAIWFRSVRALAEQHRIQVIAPRDVNAPAVVEQVRALEPDFLFSAMFRQLLKSDLLALPRRGALNLHPSLLPRFRGRSPINWVLVEGETETGVTLHYMVEKADRGDIVAQRRIAIAEDDTALTLHHKATAQARLLLREAYPLLASGRAPRIVQDQAQASYYGGRTPADGEIDWRRPARRIYDLIRAVTHPYPGAFTWRDGRRLLIWWARPGAPPRTLRPGEVDVADGVVWVGAGDGALRLETIEIEGERERSAAQWAASGGCRSGET